jgi:hypothetical protein
MSRWQEQFDSHAIHQTLEQINEWLNVELDDLNEGDIGEIRRCQKVLAMLTKSVGDLDVEVAPAQQLDTLNQQLRHQNIWNQLNSFASNKNVQHVINVNDQLNPVIQALIGLVPYSKTYAHEDTLRSLQESVDKTINGLAKKKKNINDDFEALSQNVTELSNVNAQLETTIEQRRLEVDQQISQWQQQFSDAQEKRSSGFAEWKDKIESELRNKTSEIVKDTTVEIDELNETSKESLNKTIAAAEQKHNEIVELFQLASGDSISGGYAQTANNERFQSNFWRGMAVAFICVTAYWIMTVYFSALERNYSSPPLTVLENKNSDSGQAKELDSVHIKNVKNVEFDWNIFLLSVSLTGVLLYGAAFSALQSNRHRENEKQMRWFALQIKALDPYINSLNEEDQKELKKTLSEKFFTAPSDSNTKDNVLSEHAVSTLAKAMAEVLKASKG